jgi:acyl-CoA thioester hydrolase
MSRAPRPKCADDPAVPSREALRVRVAFADTDAMGVAWHGSYLRWFEMARTELLRATELPYAALVERDLHLPVIEALVRYRKPARYDDELVVLAATSRIGGVRLRIDYRIECGGALIAEGHTEHAFTNAAGRVQRPPRDVQAVFTRLAAEHGG